MWMTDVGFRFSVLDSSCWQMMHRNFYGRFPFLDDAERKWDIHNFRSWNHQYWSVWIPGATFNQLTGHQGSKDTTFLDDSVRLSGTGAGHLKTAIGLPEKEQQYLDFLQDNQTAEIEPNVQKHQSELSYVNENCMKICGLVLLIQCVGMHWGILGQVWKQTFRLNLKRRRSRALLQRSTVLSVLASICEFITVSNICCEHQLVLSYKSLACKAVTGLQICVCFSVACRLSFRFRRDRLGEATCIGSSRKKVRPRSKPKVNWTGIFLCLNLVSAHAAEHFSKGNSVSFPITDMENVTEEYSSLFQFVPPPDVRFSFEVEQQWVRSTVVDHFPRIKFPTETFLFNNQHWPILLCYHVGAPGRTWAAGMRVDELLTPDTVRLKVRRAMHDVFANDEVVTVGAVVPQLWTEFPQDDSLILLTMQGRVQPGRNPSLIYLRPGRLWEASFIPVLFGRSVSREEVIHAAGITQPCERPGVECRVLIEAAYEVSLAKHRLSGWQRIDVLGTEESPLRCSKETEETALMQTFPTTPYDHDADLPESKSRGEGTDVTLFQHFQSEHLRPSSPCGDSDETANNIGKEGKESTESSQFCKTQHEVGFDRLRSGFSFDGNFASCGADTHSDSSFFQPDYTPFCERQQSFHTWFAETGWCNSETRIVTINPNRLDELRTEFNKAWKDKCASECSFIFVRPQPHDFFAVRYSAHVLVFPVAVHAATLRVQIEDRGLESRTYQICAEAFRWKNARHKHGSLVVVDMRSTDDESCLMQQLTFTDLPADTQIDHVSDFLPVPFRHGTVCFDLINVQSSDLLRTLLVDRTSIPAERIRHATFWTLTSVLSLQRIPEHMELNVRSSWSLGALSIYRRLQGDGTVDATLIGPTGGQAWDPLRIQVVLHPMSLHRDHNRVILLHLIFLLPPVTVAMRISSLSTLGEVLHQLEECRSDGQSRFVAFNQDTGETLRDDSVMTVASGDQLTIYKARAVCDRQQHDDVSVMMQMSTNRAADSLQYLTSILEDPYTECVSWMHQWPDRDSPQAISRHNMCSFGTRLKDQFEEIWKDKIPDEGLIIRPIRPMPPYGTRLLPSFLMLTREDSRIHPILIDYNMNQEWQRFTVMIPAHEPPVSVSAIFDHAKPDHECDRHNCFLLHDARLYPLWTDFPIMSGQYVRLHEEIALGTSDATVTTCSIDSQDEANTSTSNSSSQLGSTNSINEESVLMQTSFDYQAVPIADSQNFRTWLHLDTLANACVDHRRDVRIRNAHSIHDQVWHAWGAEIVRPPHIVFVPDEYPDEGGPTVHLIVLEQDREDRLPIIADYVSPDRVFARSCLLTRAFIPVHSLFDVVFPGNSCRFDTLCKVRIRSRIYIPGETVILWEGALARLTEMPIDESSNDQFSWNATGTPSEQSFEYTTSTDTDTEDIASPEDSIEEGESDDNQICLTQIDLDLFKFVRDAETGRPVHVRMRASGILQDQIHWRAFEQEAFDKTIWYKEDRLRNEIAQLRPLEARGHAVYLLAFGLSSPIPFQANVHWQDEWSLDPGLLEARAEIRLMIWDRVPPATPYLIGTADPQPTTRQQNGGDNLYIVAQPEEDEDVAILLVTNFASIRGDQYFLRATRVTPMSSREQLLQDIAMAGLCRISTCIVSHDADIWHEGTQYLLAIGTRIDLEVRPDEPIRDSCAADSLDEQAESEEDHIHNVTIEVEEDEDPSLLHLQGTMRTPEGNTATSIWDRSVLEEDSMFLVQTGITKEDEEVSVPQTRLDRCIDRGTPWYSTLRLRLAELYWIWQWNRVDMVADYFAQMGHRKPSIQLVGWIFRSHDQPVGTDFAWGLRADAPWALQFTRLLQGAQFGNGLLYTVAPQPGMETEVESKHKGTSYHVIVPMEQYQFAQRILIVEHTMPMLSRVAIHCAEPCSVISVFTAIGKKDKCSPQAQCIASYTCELCHKDFADQEPIEVPTASLITLSVLPRPETHRCRSKIGRVREVATSVANSVHRPGTPSHQSFVRKARRILMHSPNRAEPETPSDTSSLMQRETGSAARIIADSVQSKDIEVIRVRTGPIQDPCQSVDIQFHFLQEDRHGHSQTVESCPRHVHSHAESFRRWVVDRMPSYGRRERRAFLTTMKLLPNAWTILTVPEPRAHVIPVVLRVLETRMRFPALNIVYSGAFSTARAIYEDFLNNDRRPEILAQIQDIAVNPDHYFDIVPALVLDVQEIEDIEDSIDSTSLFQLHEEGRTEPSLQQADTTQFDGVRNQRFDAIRWSVDDEADWIDIRFRNSWELWGWPAVEAASIIMPDNADGDPSEIHIRLQDEDWDNPALTGAVRSAWPWLSTRRFRLFRAEPILCIANDRADILLVVLPGGDHGTNPNKIAVLEVVVWSGGQIMAKQFAVRTMSVTSPRELAEAGRIEDCAVKFCEFRSGIHRMRPDETIHVTNGAHFLIAVHEHPRPTCFQVTGMAIRRPSYSQGWTARDQVFPRDGTVLVMKPILAHRAQRQAEVQVEEWHTWGIFAVLLSFVWPDFLSMQTTKIELRATWKSIPELKDYAHAIVVADLPMPPQLCHVVLVIRDLRTEDIHIKPVMWTRQIEVTHILTQENLLDICGDQADCLISQNGRSKRFVPTLRVEHGDLVGVQIRYPIRICQQERSPTFPEADDSDLVAFMQRPEVSLPTTLSTRSAQISSLNAPMPPSIMWAYPPRATMYRQVMTHLWRYWEGSAWYGTPTDLMVFCINHQDRGTSATSQYCPAEYIAPYVPDHNFAAWCRGISPILWRPDAAVFPVLGDVYVNIPSILIVDDVAGTQVPFVVHITGRGNSLVLAYVTTQALTTMDVVTWVTNDFPFTGEVSLEYAGRRLRGNEILRISSGGLFRVILHDPFFQPPEGATSYTEDSTEETTHGTWSSADLLPANTLPILRLPSPTALIADWRGRIYGAQMPEDLEDPSHTLMMMQKAVNLRVGKQLRINTHTSEGEIGEFYPISLKCDDRCRKACWHKEPTRGLQPPGNPDETSKHANISDQRYPCVTPFGRRIISISELIPGPSGESLNNTCKNPRNEGPAAPLGLPNLDAQLAFRPSTDGLQHDLDLLDKLDPAIMKKLREQYWCLLEDWNNDQVDDTSLHGRIV